jgi:hypothetical protein
MASDLRRILLAAAVFTSCAVVSPLAHAEPTLSDRETARSLMEDGDAKRDKGDFRAALKSYEAADAIMKVPTTGLEVGRAQAQLGMLLEARETLNRVAKLPAKPGEPPPFEKARKSAEQLSTEVAARIPSVTVAVSGVEPGQTPQVIFDGEPVPPAASAAPRKVNPGQHTIVVKAGTHERKEDVLVAEREQKMVTVDVSVPKGPIVDPPNPEEPQKPGGSSTPKILMIGGFALGAVGIGVGAVTGIMSITKVNSIKNGCPDNHCTPDKQSDIDSAKGLGTISTIAFIAGGVGVAVGVVGLLMSGKSGESEPAQGVSKPVRVKADVGPTWLGVSGAF